jgi:hypothetical protein
MSEKKLKMMEAIMKKMAINTGPSSNAILNKNDSSTKSQSFSRKDGNSGSVYTSADNIFFPGTKSMIKLFLDFPISNFEIEASFGTFRDRAFNPGLKAFQIINLQRQLDRLTLSQGGTLDVNTHSDVVEKVSNSNVRKISSENRDTIYQKKDRSSLDNIDNSLWGIRISKSREEYADESDFDKENWEMIESILENPKIAENPKERNMSPVIGIRRVRKRRSYSETHEDNEFYGAVIDISSIKETHIREDGTLYSIFKHEVEIERNNDSLRLEKFINIISRIIQFYQNAINISSILDQKEIRIAINLHNKIFEEDISRSNKQVGFNKIFQDYWNKPKNVKTQYMLEKEFDPSVTIKLDGIRYTLFFSENGSYIFNPPDDVIKVGPYNRKLTGTVLDCEYLSVYDSKQQKTIISDIYAFDILFFQGKDVRRMPFKERLDMMKNIAKDVGMLYGIKYHTKKFFQDGDFYDRTRDAFEEIEGNELYRIYNLVDGLILQPKNWYKNNNTYKWKDEKNLTIDFIYSPIDPPDGEDENNKFFQLMMGSKSGNMVFNGSVNNPISGYTILDSEMFNGIDISGKIVESYWDSELNLFLPRRIRDDKIKPNFHSTVLDVWDDITNPIPESTMKGHTLQLVRKFHNSKKLSMLKTFKENSTIIDMGSGRGGDLSKWDKVKMKRVYVIEPNPINLKELLRRKDESGFKTDIKVLNKGIEETSIISKDLKSNKDYYTFDGIVSFSSLTYIPKDKELYANLLKTINLIPNGKRFIGNVMEGERVRSLLEKTRDELKINEEEVVEYITDSFTIRQVTEFDNDVIGNEIEIDISDSTSMVKEQTEWLFYFEPFRKSMEDMGFKLIASDYLDHGPVYNLLPNDSKMFSRLYRTFTFQRESGGVEILQDEEKEDEEEEEFIEDEVDEEIKLSKLYSENLYYSVVQRDSSNFIHAVLRAISPEYFKMNQEERSIYVSKIRKTMGGKLTKKVFKTLHGGELAKCLIEPHLKKHSYEEALEIVFLQFKLQLSNIEEWTGDNFLLELTSILLEIDIYIISLLDNEEELRVSKKFSKICDELYVNEKAVMLITFDGKYYDVVGRKYRNKISYIYNSSSSFIKSIRKEICN